MQRLEVSGAVRPIHGSLGVKRLIINYGIIIKSISTFMYTVWHVDKYKITFELVINHWTNGIL